MTGVYLPGSNRLDIDVSAQLIHRQITLSGSWVTSLPRTDELVELLVRWDLHPESIVTHRYGLADGERPMRRPTREPVARSPSSWEREREEP